MNKQRDGAPLWVVLVFMIAGVILMVVSILVSDQDRLIAGFVLGTFGYVLENERQINSLRKQIERKD